MNYYHSSKLTFLIKLHQILKISKQVLAFGNIYK